MRRWVRRALPILLLVAVHTPAAADAIDDYLRAEMQRRQIPGLGSLERHGERVSRVCHYRLVNATATYYYSFWLAGDGRIADFWSSTE